MKLCLPTVSIAVAILVFSSVVHAEPVKLTRKGDKIDVAIGGQPFTTYTFDPVIAKPFLEPLRDAKGTIVTRTLSVGNEVPPGHEHDNGFEPHQRAMYFDHGSVDGYDFWGEEVFKKYYGPSDDNDQYGRMVFRKVEEMKSGSSVGIVKATFDLEGPDKKPFAEETQEYKFSRDGDSHVVACKYHK
jgi:hypothetical protein